MANRQHDHRVPRNDDKTIVREVKQSCKLLDFVMQTLDGISRNKAKSILAHGGVTVDGRVQSHVDYPLDEGYVVQIRRHARPSSATNSHYRIVYEDQWIVVVDKQQGVLSMPVGAGSLNAARPPFCRDTPALHRPCGTPLGCPHIGAHGLCQKR